jgi:uncharacterized protein (DUF58 family)
MTMLERHLDARRLHFRTMRKVDSLFAGEYESAFKGRGIEFAEVRQYEPGDDVRTIDWNVTARAGVPYVKQFVEERELTIMLAADMSASGEFGSVASTKRQLTIDVIAAIASVAAQHNDRVGLVLFTDEVEKVIRPKKGSRHVHRLMTELVGFEPHRRGTDIGSCLGYIEQILHRRSIVFVASDFRDEGWEQGVGSLTRRHDFVGLHVADPRELAVPPIGLASLEDPETGETYLVDTASERNRVLFAEAAHEVLDETKAKLLSRGADYVRLSTDKSFVGPLVRYFQARKMRR